MKNKFEFGKSKGITLLALIITVIVMLILAGVSLSMTFGEDGVIAKAQKAEEEQRYATVVDHRDLWWSNLKLGRYDQNITNIQDLNELVEDLKTNGVITEEEKKEILGTGELKFDLLEKSVVFYEIRRKNRTVCKI